MKKYSFYPALAIMCSLAGPLGAAQDIAPDVLVKSVTAEVLTIIRQDSVMHAGNSANIVALVEERIVPHFDFPRMTRLAAGRNWRLATETQQLALTAEFRTLLVRTYSSALSGYRDEVINYKPMRGPAGATEVTVKSEVKQGGAPSMTVDYDMEKTAAGWKVYDIQIGGISLVTTYRDAFASRVRDGGIDGLIKALGDKNKLPVT
jgi:phospholipid transport system substrate-binding protein